MTAHDRCDGSGQLTMTTDARKVRCPVCRADVAAVPDGAGRAVLVDHRPRRDDALPVTLGLFA
jgi:hypothetical protein